MQKISKWLFLALCLISILLVFVSSNEPIISLFENTFVEDILINSLSGNSIVFNLSMGIVVSSIFYLIVVYIPEKQKEKDIQPQIEQYISGVLARSWRLVSETIKHSGKEYEMNSITKEQFLEVCKLVNPQNVKQNFHNNGVDIYEHHFGYACAINWEFILKNINDVMYFLPYVDTGLVKILNQIRSSSLGIMVGSLKEIEKLKNTDMSAWAPCIYEVYKLGVELESYYKKHININFKHPFKKI